MMHDVPLCTIAIIDGLYKRHDKATQRFPVIL